MLCDDTVVIEHDRRRSVPPSAPVDIEYDNNRGHRVPVLKAFKITSLPYYNEFYSFIFTMYVRTIPSIERFSIGHKVKLPNNTPDTCLLI